MSRIPKSPRHLIGDRVVSARTRTEKVQEEIERAEADLHLANLVITDKLAESVTDAELAKAVTDNAIVEAKLHAAGADLRVVTDLLSSEERDRKKLEATLAQYRDGDGAAAGSRSGEGSASVIEHLRELTRHKVNADHVDPARHDVPGSPDAGT
jgi:hypothetical protein